MSSVIVGWIVVTPLAIAICWLIWYIWNNNRKLDAKLSQGDLTLLSSPSYKISEIIRAPAGSRVEKVAISVLPPGATGYIQQQLPDGSIAMIPVRTISQPIKSIHSTTHTTQRPPEM